MLQVYIGARVHGGLQGRVDLREHRDRVVHVGMYVYLSLVLPLYLSRKRAFSHQHCACCAHQKGCTRRASVGGDNRGLRTIHLCMHAYVRACVRLRMWVRVHAGAGGSMGRRIGGGRWLGVRKKAWAGGGGGGGPPPPKFLKRQKPTP